MTDVTIVGGGPTGILSSLLLAQRGFGVRVIERDEGVYDLPRAITMDDETQRVFQGLGLTEGLRAITTALPGAEFVTVEGERIIGGDFPPGMLSPLGHPPGVLFYQPQLEQFVRDAAVDAGVELLLGVECTHTEQSSDSVTAHTSLGSFESDWLIAADGASSPIRKANEIDFVDQGFDQDWLVLDVELKRRVDTLPHLVQQICDPARPTTFVTGHNDYRRWEFQLQAGETREQMLADDQVWRLLSRWITPADAHLIRAVVYRFHATVADRMRAGRTFLAGDAAHQMPPFVGQGMCSGIRDAANLAWKLDLVAKGQATGALLDTYDAERRPHAEEVVAHAVETGRLIDRLAGRESNEAGIEAGYGGGRPFPRLEHGMTVGDLPVGKQLPQPVFAEAPLDDSLGLGFAVLTHDAAALPDSALARWVDLDAHVVTLPDDVLANVIPPDGAAVARPDRYIAGLSDAAGFGHLTNDLLKEEWFVS